MAILQKLAATKAPSATILIRLLTGGIFLSEGIQKFLFPDMLGAGRFEKIGIPNPHFFGPSARVNWLAASCCWRDC